MCAPAGEVNKEGKSAVDPAPGGWDCFSARG